jgi:hypothetical protein
VLRCSLRPAELWLLFGGDLGICGDQSQENRSSPPIHTINSRGHNGGLQRGVEVKARSTECRLGTRFLIPPQAVRWEREGGKPSPAVLCAGCARHRDPTIAVTFSDKGSGVKQVGWWPSYRGVKRIFSALLSPSSSASSDRCMSSLWRLMAASPHSMTSLGRS